MENIQVFTSSEFGEIRTIERENGIWFVGRDIAAALGYTDYFGAIKKHIDEEDKLVCQIDSAGQRKGQIYLVNKILERKIEQPQLKA